MKNYKRWSGLAGVILLTVIYVLRFEYTIEDLRYSMVYHLGMLLLSDVVCKEHDLVLFSAVRYGTLKKRRRAVSLSALGSLLLMVIVLTVTLCLSGFSFQDVYPFCHDSLIILAVYRYMCQCVSLCEEKALLTLAVKAVFVVELFICSMFEMNYFFFVHSLVIYHNASAGFFAVFMLLVMDILMDLLERILDI